VALGVDLRLSSGQLMRSASLTCESPGWFASVEAAVGLWPGPADGRT
jgi:hypothetical protein